MESDLFDQLAGEDDLEGFFRDITGVFQDAADWQLSGDASYEERLQQLADWDAVDRGNNLGDQFHETVFVYRRTETRVEDADIRFWLRVPVQSAEKFFFGGLDIWAPDYTPFKDKTTDRTTRAQPGTAPYILGTIHNRIIDSYATDYITNIPPDQSVGTPLHVNVPADYNTPTLYQTLDAVTTITEEIESMYTDPCPTLDRYF